MREEFIGGVGLLVLSLRLVPWWIQVLFELWFEIFFGNQLLIQISNLFIVFIRFVTLLSALFLF